MGIFDDRQHDLFAVYRAELQFRDRWMGGTPKDPRIIEGWLRSKAGIEQEEEIRQATLRTLAELGVEVRSDMTFTEMERASEALALVKQTNGAKRDASGLYIESRTIKAMLKESINILYAGDRWGRTKKGPRSFFAERVFVGPDHISLGVHEPDGIELFIGHVTGPEGPRSTLTYHEYVERARISFEVMVLRDEVADEHWPEVWLHAQENGLGALRSQGFGRFDVEVWERVATGLGNGKATRGSLVTA